MESFAHIECYSDCSRRESNLVKPLCYGVILLCVVPSLKCCMGVFGMFAVI